MTKAIVSALFVVLTAWPLHADSIKSFECSRGAAWPAHGDSIKSFNSTREGFENSTYRFRTTTSHDKEEFGERSSKRNFFDREDYKKHVRFSHETRRERYDWDPDDAVVAATAEAPEVPTAWLLVLGSLALFGAGPLRRILSN